jgi:hypothetical protein
MSEITTFVPTSVMTKQFTLDDLEAYFSTAIKHTESEKPP